MNDCPHSALGSADRCSQCLQAAGALTVPVRRVEIVDAIVTVDGETVRETVEQEYDRFRGRR